MTRVQLTRLETSDQGTFGRLQAPGLTLFSGELPWRDNRPNISCIPVGDYLCRWTLSPRFKRFMYSIESVEKRAGVRVHSANFMGAKPPYQAHLNGCVALGERLGWMARQKALLVSMPAVRRFEAHMGRKPFLLEVRGV